MIGDLHQLVGISAVVAVQADRDVVIVVEIGRFAVVAGVAALTVTGTVLPSLATSAGRTGTLTVATAGFVTDPVFRQPGGRTSPAVTVRASPT